MRRFCPGSFPARRLAARRMGPLLTTETRYGVREVLPLHAHELGCIVVLLEGSFVEEFGERGRACTAPAVLVRPPEEPHTDRFGADGGRVLNVEIPAHWVADAGGSFPEFSCEVQGLQERLAAGLVREFRTASRTSSARLSALVAMTLADALPLPPRTAGAADARVRRVRALVEEHFRESWSLAAFAHEVGMHPASLARAFRRTYGQSVGALIRKLRVQEACRLLAAGGRPLADVAQAVGFYDQAHFTRVFRSLLGATPREYERLLRP